MMMNSKTMMTSSVLSFLLHIATLSVINAFAPVEINPRPASHASTGLYMSDSNGNSSGMPVTVVGGTGFVGSRVCKILVERGMAVTSLSKSGIAPKWCSDEAWTSQVDWKSIDLLSASESELDTSMGKPKAVISCVGVIGTDPDVLYRGNGESNINAFESAKRVGSVDAVSFVSVSSEVVACQDNWLPEFFQEYFRGKLNAEQAAMEVCDGAATIVRPTFIYGGDSFGLLPPRVNDAYGSFIDQLLSFVLFDALANVTPGLIKVALRPPVSVNAVAGACVAGIQSKQGQILDTAEAINTAANQPAATGVEDAIAWVVETSGKAVDFVNEKIKEQQAKK